jgi:hypothetical protein
MKRTPALPEVSQYRSSFKAWDQRAGVRVKPRRKIDSAETSDIFFPPELVPAASHPLVTRLGSPAVKRILVDRLYQYLNFTTLLELVAVIPVTAEISTNRSGLVLDGHMRRDAFKISTDEAWHAQFSDDLIADVAAHTRIPVTLQGEPLFIGRLAALRDQVDHRLRASTPLAFAIVSETLISTILSDLPNDRRLPQAVRDLVRDHAEDEGRHHAYFKAVLRAFWPTLTKSERRQLGPLLPELITIFLEPDFKTVSGALFNVGLSDSQVEQVLAESYPQDTVRAGIAAAARATVRYFGELGAMDDPTTQEAFQAAGMLA